MSKFVLNGTELDSKKADAKNRIRNALGSAVAISDNTVEVNYSTDEPKLAQVLGDKQHGIEV